MYGRVEGCTAGACICEAWLASGGLTGERNEAEVVGSTPLRGHL